MTVLYLSEWYPNRYDAMLGLFVRKHAEAVVRQGVRVIVLYLHHDTHLSKQEVIIQQTNGVEEIYVYYPSSYMRALIRGYKEVQRLAGKPDVCQLNVITKNGLLPLYLKLVHHIPYVIVEHWTGYTPQNPSIQRGWHLRLMHAIARNAQRIMPVSEDLGQAMRSHGFSNRNWQVINNVVDDFFYTENRPQNPVHFVHISCFDNNAKNIPGILRAIQQVSLLRSDFHFTLIGTGVDFLADVQLAHDLGIDHLVTFTGELPPDQVHQTMIGKTALVMFSNYENAPVVISESLAMGIPVLSTDVGGIREMLSTETGILIEQGDESALATQLRHMLDHHGDFNRDAIRQEGKKYSYDTVGKELINIYQSTL